MRDRLIIQRAKELRSNLTEAESRLWYFLRRNHLGCRFRRQHPIGPYVADFACLRPRIVIELDGGQHLQQHHYDEARDKFMRERGFVVLRFWSNEMLERSESVLQVIWGEIESRKKTPPP
jgi:very-short-patch-repair endonuclease